MNFIARDPFTPNKYLTKEQQEEIRGQIDFPENFPTDPERFTPIIDKIEAYAKVNGTSDEVLEHAVSFARSICTLSMDMMAFPMESMPILNLGFLSASFSLLFLTGVLDKDQVQVIQKTVNEMSDKLPSA